MVTKQDVLTPERYASAISYEQFLAPPTENVDEFNDNYQHTVVPEELKRRLQALVAKPNGPKKLLVLGEGWCPDVYRGMPVLKRLAEAAGIDYKALKRDQHLDIMNAYLNKGEFQSIPCALFYTDDLDLLLVWHERPESVTAEISEYRNIIGDRTREEAAGDMKAFRQGPKWAQWRIMTIEDITRQLEAKVG